MVGVGVGLFGVGVWDGCTEGATVGAVDGDGADGDGAELDDAGAVVEASDVVLPTTEEAAGGTELAELAFTDEGEHADIAAMVTLVTSASHAVLDIGCFMAAPVGGLAFKSTPCSPRYAASPDMSTARPALCTQCDLHGVPGADINWRYLIDRREFLRLAGAAALTGAVASLEGCTSRAPTPSRTPSSLASSTATQPASTSADAASAVTSATTSAAPATSAAAAEIADLDALAKALGPRLLRPTDHAYLPASRLFSTRFDAVRPAAVARCTSVDDITRCLEFVRATGTKVAARSGGHSFAGYSTTSGLVIDVGPMNEVKSLNATTARVGAGATLIDVYAGLAGNGQSVPGGSCPTVGITGLALGGGIGVVSRKYGLTCDAVTAVEVVLPDGTLVRCTESDDADLFWAHRGGGGGNFGIVTALEFRTHPTSDLTHFLVRWNWADAHNVVTAWQQWLPTTPNELWSSLHVDGAGSASDSPHVYASGVFVGSAARLKPLLDALQSASKAAMTTRSVAQNNYLATMFVEGGCANLSTQECHRADTVPGGKLGREANAARSDFISTELSAAGVDVLLSGIEQRRKLGLPGGSVLFDAYGGAVNSVGPADTAFVHRDKLACLQYVAPWSTSAPPSVVAANQAWLDAFYATMRPHVSGFAYLNYIDPKLADWQQAYYGTNLDRLIGVKTAADPHNLLGFAQGVPTR